VRKVSLLPAFVVGLALAVAGETAVGLLLYTGPGFLRSLTVLLGVEALALGLGLVVASSGDPDLPRALRQRWILTLLAFLSAAVWSVVWSLVDGLGDGAVEQGIGLAVLAVLPIFSSGVMLGTMQRAEREHGSASVGAPAALGAAAGFVVAGAFLVKAPTPASLFLVCLIFLSAAALLHGAHDEDEPPEAASPDEASPEEGFPERSP